MTERPDPNDPEFQNMLMNHFLEVVDHAQKSKGLVRFMEHTPFHELTAEKYALMVQASEHTMYVADYTIQSLAAAGMITSKPELMDGVMDVAMQQHKDKEQ